MTDVTEQLQRWAPVAKALGDARLQARPRLSKRGAAKRAGISDAHWRHMEAGYRIVAQTKLPPAVSAQVLEEAAEAFGLDPAPLFDALGWDYSPVERPTPPKMDELASLRADLNQLTSKVDRLAQAFERLDNPQGEQ